MARGGMAGILDRRIFTCGRHCQIVLQKDFNN